MVSSLKVAKQQLRLAVKGSLQLIPPESIALQSHRVFEALKSLTPYQEARRISVYLSMPRGEIQTDAIVRHALSSGKQVFVPFLHKPAQEQPEWPSRVMDMVELTSVADYESLQPDKWGIPSIDAQTVHRRRSILGGSGHECETSQTELDLMLVPGVAFDVDESDGAIRRLGHGRGFYDLFIHRYLQGIGVSRPPVPLYGLVLAEQLLGPPSMTPVPVGPLDKPLDGLIRGDGRITDKSSPGALDPAVSQTA